MASTRIIAGTLALALSMPSVAFAQEKPLPPPIIFLREPTKLDLPARARSEFDAVRPRAPTPREIKLSEEGWVLVIASIIVGTVVLVYLVSTAAK
jgi:hypothetical protein